MPTTPSHSAVFPQDNLHGKRKMLCNRSVSVIQMLAITTCSNEFEAQNGRKSDKYPISFMEVKFKHFDFIKLSAANLATCFAIEFMQ
jgi:hypothetical protein